MAIFSEVNAKESKKQEADKTEDLTLRIFFGVFFDGTSNNMIQRSKALAIRKKHTTGLFGLGNHHKYEQVQLDKNDAEDLDNQKDDGFYKKGSDFKGFSNVAIMHSKYQGIEEAKREEKGYLTKVFKIYVEGSGANDIDNGDLLKEGTSGIATNGLGFGVGKTGVVALVSKAVVAVNAILKSYKGGKYKAVELHFDVFGFSRGSACARLFSFLVQRKNNENLDKREYEFGKFSAKGEYDGNRLNFLNEYAYEEPALGKKTKKVEFLGIFDTVSSIGLLRRKKLETDEGKNSMAQIVSRRVNYLVSNLNDKDGDINKTLRKKMEMDFLGGKTAIYLAGMVIPVEVNFIQGIFNDILNHIQMPIRKKLGRDGADDNHFLLGGNQINPLRAGMFYNKDFMGNLHDLNVKEYGLFSPSRGIKTLQICAMDEFRENFALVDLGEIVPKDSLEIFLPGCHSDIGGGYVCGDHTKSVINKYASFFAADTEKVNVETLSLVEKNPQSKEFVSAKANLETLAKLGWIPTPQGDKKHWWSNHETAKTTMEDDGVNVQGKHGMIDRLKETERGRLTGYDEATKKHYAIAEFEFWEDDKRVGFEHTTPSFFSNVPLRLMVERARKEVNRQLFNKDLDIAGGAGDDTSFYNVPSGLQDFYNDVREKTMSENGKRMFFYPEQNYSSKTYQTFRQNYLHFTSEQNFGINRLWDVHNQIQHVMCRIVYHGGEKDDSKMHYMQDFNETVS